MAEIIPFRPKQGGSGQAPPSGPQGAEESPIELYNQLRRQAEQGRLSHQAAVSEVNTESGQIKKPSFFIYFILYYFAIGIDILEYFAKPVEATIVGEVPIIAIRFLVSALFFVAGIWLGRKIKNARKSAERSVQYAEQAIQRAGQYQQWATSLYNSVRGSRMGQRFFKSRTGQKLVGAAAKFARASKYPVLRTAAAGLAELVPLLDLVPWYTLNIYLTKRDHQREYTAAKASLEEAQGSLMSEQQELGSFNNSLGELRNHIEGQEKAA
ncbi:MAG: hypothetical protein AAB561_01300 [Patescibacteria group bacterium]